MTQPPTPTDNRKRRILVAEDEDLILRLFEGILGKAGFEVLGAQDGNKAIALFDGAADSIDLVITDLALPGVSGEAFAAHVRQARPEMKIIFSSGNITDTPKRLLEEFKGATLLPKPFSFDELVTLVKQTLAQPASC